MTIKNTIQSAIERSISHNEIVDVDVDNLAEALAAVRELWDGETDSTEVSPDLIRDDSIESITDVWGWNDSTPENEQEWRLNLRLLNA